MYVLIQLILSTGTSVVVIDEVCYGGVMRRPLTRNFVLTGSGIVTEITEYAEPADSRSWGAIKTVSYSLTSQTNVDKQTLYQEKKKSGSAMDDLLVALRNQSLTGAEIATLLNTISLVLILLISGNMQAARLAANNIATTALYTNARKNWLVSRLDAEIAKP